MYPIHVLHIRVLTTGICCKFVTFSEIVYILLPVHTCSNYILVTGVEIQCIGHFKLLFCLLRLDDCAKLQQYALEVSPPDTSTHYQISFHSVKLSDSTAMWYIQVLYCILFSCCLYSLFVVYLVYLLFIQFICSLYTYMYNLFAIFMDRL
jgi:hypothetical protein